MPNETLSNLPLQLWRIKGTLLIQVIVIAIGVFTDGMTLSRHRRLLDRFGFDYRLLTEGRIWHLASSTWIQTTPGIELTMLALLFGGTAFLEVLAGTPAMLVVCITGDWFATVLTALSMRVFAGLGSATATALLAAPDAGSSALAHAGYGAAVMLLPRRWLKVALPIVVALTAIQFLIVDVEPAIAHAFATLYGVAVGWFVLRPRLVRARRATLDDVPTASTSMGKSEKAAGM